MVTHIILLWLASLLLGYSLAFGRATLDIGRSISSTDSPTGFQDAITPPWVTRFTILAYAVSIGVVGYGWYEYGWLAGISITIAFFCFVVIDQVVLLPKKDSYHFRRLIISSMMNRYADCIKSGDSMRASAAAALLEKLNAPIPENFRG